MAVGVIAKGDIFCAKGFGFLDEKRLKPVTEASAFRIASVSKLFTAQAVMRLVQGDKLSLDEDISKYPPRLQKQ